jgi:hypothetical protein
LYIINPLDNLSPIYLPDPINRSHPLMRGRQASWMVIPGLDGGRQLYDAIGQNHITLNSTWTGRMWSSIASPGGFGSWNNANTGSTSPGTSPGPNVAGPPMSFMAWLRVTTAGAYQWVMTGSGNHGGFGLGGGSAGTALTYYWEGNEYDFASGLIPNLNEWTLVASSITPTAATLYMVDSRGVASATNTKTHNAYTATGYVFGCSATATSQSWKGQFDDISIYNRVLTAAEIWQYYCLSKAGYAGLLNRWPSRSIDVVSAILNAVAALIGVGNLQATGSARVAGSAGLVGVSSVAAAGAALVNGGAAMAGVGLLTPAGVVITQATANLIGVGSVQATGSIFAAGAAALISVAALTATGVVRQLGQAALSSVGALSGSGVAIVQGGATLIGCSLVTGSGSTGTTLPLIIITSGASGDGYVLSGGLG